MDIISVFFFFFTHTDQFPSRARTARKEL
jgi:hypothetical protein